MLLIYMPGVGARPVPSKVSELPTDGANKQIEPLAKHTLTIWQEKKPLRELETIYPPPAME